MANKKRAMTDEGACNADEATILENLNENETKSSFNKTTAVVNSAKNAFDSLTKAVSNAEKTASAMSEAANRVYVYIGPSVKGVITSGSIFAGSKKEILSRIEVSAKAAGAESLMESIGRLIFADINVAFAKEKLRGGGNSLSIAYNSIAAGKEGA